LLLFAKKDPQDLPDSFLHLLLGLFQQPQHLIQALSQLSQLRLINVPICFKLWLDVRSFFKVYSQF